MAKQAQDSKLWVTVAILLCLSAQSHSIEVPGLIDRAAELSELLHSLSTSLKMDLDSQYPLIRKMMVPSHSQCHTSSIKPPDNKEQVLRLTESELLSFARSLLLSWNNPLLLLTSEAASLPHPLNSAIHTKTSQLQNNSKMLSDGLDILVHKMGISPYTASSLPFKGVISSQNENSNLINFYFLISCFRRDSHKIDSFLKILRCRAYAPKPEAC
ncbi:hypothetical protein JZ751_026318, partial [Albula glossodonta]